MTQWSCFKLVNYHQRIYFTQIKLVDSVLWRYIRRCSVFIVDHWRFYRDTCHPSWPASYVFGAHLNWFNCTNKLFLIAAECTIKQPRLKVSQQFQLQKHWHQNAPFSVLDFKMFSAVLTFSEKEIPGRGIHNHTTIYLFQVNFFAPGNRLCKNAPKTVEATNILDSDNKSLFHVIIWQVKKCC